MSSSLTASQKTLQGTLRVLGNQLSEVSEVSSRTRDSVVSVLETRNVSTDDLIETFTVPAPPWATRGILIPSLTYEDDLANPGDINGGLYVGGSATEQEYMNALGVRLLNGASASDFLYCLPRVFWVGGEGFDFVDVRFTYVRLSGSGTVHVKFGATIIWS